MESYEEPDDAISLKRRIIKPQRKLRADCNRGKEDQIEDPLVGSVARTMQGSRGIKSTLYIIGDYLYCNGVLQSNKVKMRCRNSKNCRRYAYLEPETLQVIKFTREHTCVKDPYLRFQIQMENEMKEMAEASAQGSKTSFREIYDIVCKKYPVVAPRITFSRMYKVMDGRWRQFNPTTVY